MTSRPHFFPQTRHAPTSEKGEHWQTKAPCREDPATFEYNTNTSRVQLKRARDICATCPVRDSCLEWAMKTREPFGIWAGMTPAERRALRGEDPERLCLVCGHQLPGNNTRYCGSVCRADAKNERSRATHPPTEETA